jgi:gamma-glutamyltranspeptidase/glutathione hydrolase
MLNSILKALLPLTLVAGCATAQTPRTIATQHDGGAVSAADPRAAAAGIEILRAGGSAVDAEIATAIALTVVEPQSSGIGGGGFMVVHDAKTGKLFSFDGREVAPAAATGALFLDANGKPLPFGEVVPGGTSTGVPGNLRMWAMAHHRFGRLPWAKLFEPAIRLARDGFEITPRLHEFIAGRSRSARFTAWSRAYFYNADGTPKAQGTILKNPDLAATLQTIATRGADSFYVGPMAQALVATVRNASKNPSSMTVGDLASYDAKERPVLCGSYRGYRICGMGPPSGFVSMYEILKMLEPFDLRGLGPRNPDSWHLLAEAERLSYADRDAYMADPDFVAVPTKGLMSDAYLKERSALIHLDSHIAKAVAGRPPGAPRVIPAQAVEHGTSHSVSVDGDGNVATMTSTIESVFGSGLTTGGLFLNNELTDFSFTPEKGGVAVANRVEGGKRPRSAMSPTIVYSPDGHVRVALGAAGGATIISQVAKAIIAIVDWDMTAEDAIATPQLVAIGDNVAVEQGTWLESLIPALEARGHKVTARGLPLKGNAVEWRNGQWIGAADRRSEGVGLKQ